MSHSPRSLDARSDEKRDVLDFPPAPSEEQGLNLIRDWTDEEEHKAKRK
jgi:hypothetical protein